MSVPCQMVVYKQRTFLVSEDGSIAGCQNGHPVFCSSCLVPCSYYRRQVYNPRKLRQRDSFTKTELQRLSRRRKK